MTNLRRNYYELKLVLNNRVIRILLLIPEQVKVNILQLCVQQMEVGLTTDFGKNFYVFCDAIKRSIITGAKMSIDADC